MEKIYIVCGKDAKNKKHVLGAFSMREAANAFIEEAKEDGVNVNGEINYYVKYSLTKTIKYC